MFGMHLISVITDGWQGYEPPPPAELNVACILLVFSILLVSVDCCFFTFFVAFSGDFGFLYSRSIPGLLFLLNYFLSVSQ